MSMDRILSARHHAAEQVGADRPLDRIYVHGLEVDAWIGIHHQEKGQTQKVRIDVEAEILPAARNENIENTLCYDFIVGGVHAIIERGHINLVETLAEEVAAHVLGHPLARRVKVRVEKLERLPGAKLGVEILREKLADTVADIVPLPDERD